MYETAKPPAPGTSSRVIQDQSHENTRARDEHSQQSTASAPSLPPFVEPKSLDATTKIIPSESNVTDLIKCLLRSTGKLTIDGSRIFVDVINELEKLGDLIANSHSEIYTLVTERTIIFKELSVQTSQPKLYIVFGRIKLEENKSRSKENKINVIVLISFTLMRAENQMVICFGHNQLSAEDQGKLTKAPAIKALDLIMNLATSRFVDGVKKGLEGADNEFWGNRVKTYTREIPKQNNGVSSGISIHDQFLVIFQRIISGVNDSKNLLDFSLQKRQSIHNLLLQAKSSIVKQEIKEKKSVEEWRQRKEEIQAQRSSYPGAVESFYASLNPAQRHFDPQTIEILRKTKVPVPEIKKQGQAPDLEYSRYLVREYEKLLKRIAVSSLNEISNLEIENDRLQGLVKELNRQKKQTGDKLKRVGLKLQRKAAKNERKKDKYILRQQRKELEKQESEKKSEKRKREEKL